MATINKRRLVSGNIVWELSHGTGPDRQRFVAGQTREQAQHVLHQFNRQLALHGEAPSDGTVESVIGLYIQYLSGNRRRSTFRRYERVLKTFYECFLRPHCPEIVRLRQITPAHIEEYKQRRMTGRILDEMNDEASQQREADLKAQAGNRTQSYKANAKFGWLGRKRFKRSVAPRTVNYELQALRTFFQWAVRRNHLFVNPATEVERVRIPKRAMPKFLTAEQLKRLFAACNDRERTLFMTILLSGMRRGEVMHLTWSDINFEMGVIFIQEKPQWNWQPKTDERVIPISPTLRALLLAHHATRRDEGLVFPNKTGNLDTHMLPKLKKIGRRAGIPTVTVHALRHSFGAHLRMAGVNLADIADLMGHKDLGTTQIYAKVQHEHLRAVVSRLAPVVSDDATPPPKSIAQSSGVRLSDDPDQLKE
jgi:integrase